MSINDLTKSVSKMTMNSRMSSSEYSLEDKSPYRQYQYTEGNQRMLAVDFLIKAAPKKCFKLKLSNCGRFLHLRKRVPVVFFDRASISLSEEGNNKFNQDSSKAIAFDTLMDRIEKQIDINEEVFGPAQTIRLLETCDINVEIGYRTVSWSQRPKFKIRNNTQYDSNLIVELESNVKAKKRVEEKTDLVYGDSSDESSMADNDSI